MYAIDRIKLLWSLSLFNTYSSPSGTERSKHVLCVFREIPTLLSNVKIQW
jgi:hypothetical protein